MPSAELNAAIRQLADAAAELQRRKAAALVARKRNAPRKAARP